MYKNNSKNMQSRASGINDFRDAYEISAWKTPEQRRGILVARVKCKTAELEELKNEKRDAHFKPVKDLIDRQIKSVGKEIEEINVEINKLLVKPLWYKEIKDFYIVAAKEILSEDLYNKISERANELLEEHKKSL